jgi:hypothetical protein
MKFTLIKKTKTPVVLTFIVITIIWLTTNHTLSAQILVPEWTKHIECSGFSDAKSIVTDRGGNLYLTGHFYGITDFDPGPGTNNLTPIGTTDIFILKLDKNGNLVWVKQVGGSGFDTGNSISIDTSGNVYITGKFEATADFDPGEGTFNLTATGNADIFVLKLDNSGNFLWAKQIGGNNYDEGHSGAVDADGNVYLTGQFSGTADFDPGAGIHNLVSNGFYDIYILKLDTNGNFLWSYQMGGSDNDAGNSISVDPYGDIYLTGYFFESYDFDPGEGTAILTSVGSADIFIMKSDENGNFIWVKQIGSTDFDEGTSVAEDKSGSVYITGYFADTADFDPGAGNNNLTSSGYSDIFIQKLDTNGDLIWVKQIGGSSYDIGYAVAVDASGNVYTTGSFEGIADFNPGTESFNLISGEFCDIFTLVLDTNGDFIWANNVGGNGGDSGHSIAVDSLGNIITTGWFQVTADFDPYEGKNILTSTGSDNIFIQKQYACYPTSPVPDADNLPPLSVTCEITSADALIAPTATSNCVGTITGRQDLSFPVRDHSITQIVWKYDDRDGNVVTQNQMINWIPLDVTTSMSGNDITANNSNGRYQWLNCSNDYAPLFRQYGQSFSPVVSGNYAVKITEKSCVDTSDCVAFMITPDTTVYGIARGFNNDFYLAKIDPLTGTVTILTQDTLGYGYSRNPLATIDPENEIFYLQTYDRLLGIDMETGSVKFNSQLTMPIAGYFELMNFSFLDSSLYGIIRDASNQDLYLSKVEASTGVVSKISPASFSNRYAGNALATIDQVNKIFYLQSNNILFGIDMNTGTVKTNGVVNVPFEGYFELMCFNIADTNIYGITRLTSNQQLYFSKINPATGNVNIIAQNPIIGGYSANALATIDPIHGIYYFQANNRIYGIDIKTGNIITSNFAMVPINGYFEMMVFYPGFISSDIHVNSQNTKISDELISVFPNPAKDILNIVTHCNGKGNLFVYDLQGLLILSQVGNKDSYFKIDISKFSPGLYLLVFTDDKGKQFTKKIVIE